MKIDYENGNQIIYDMSMIYSKIVKIWIDIFFKITISFCYNYRFFNNMVELKLNINKTNYYTLKKRNKQQLQVYVISKN